MSPFGRTVLRFVALVLVALSFVACKASRSALEAQIRGEGCQYESVYASNPNVGSPGAPAPWRCESRELTLWDVLAPPLEATCQEDAAHCAASTKDPQLVPVLLRALTEERDEYDTGDGKIFVRASFAEALGYLGDDRAIVPLIDVLRRSEAPARTAAAEALARFEGKARAAGPELRAAYALRNPRHEMDIERLRSAAADALAKTAPELATVAFGPALSAPFADLDATELTLHGMVASEKPLPLDDALLEIAQLLRERKCEKPEGHEDCRTLARICYLAESELLRRKLAHEALDCRNR